MIYNACLVVGLMFMFVGGILFVAYGIASVVCLDVDYLRVTIVGIIMLLLGIWGVSIYNKHNKLPEVVKDNTDKKYQKLLSDVDEVNKELQKFYIDHPEYKLEEKEND